MAVIDTRLKEWLREGRTLVGLFVSIPHPALVEMAGFAGFDFVILDNEHGPAGIETTENLIRAARAAGVVPVVRVSSANTQEILRTLDIGASAVQVPQVNDRATAELAVRSAKYPPEGIRGVANSTRAAGWGFFGGLEHIERSNAGTAVVTHVETVEALRNLDDLLTVPGIDAMFIGPTDLSTSMGHPGNPGHPEVQGAIEGAIRRIAAAGKAPGILVGDPAAYRAWREKGARYLVFNIASLIVRSLTDVVAAIRS
ncbi:HpcH/HpaI aldolase family protein [Caldinitratiruptor microaerophilus]|uniref:2,4-dihydroxyhept-2-ene-1,7-dioic acid aldolase n=1 Tax=Caldinitratiruptor microaerophilus TaxID=671077 RepID=A0AA35CJ74_9FIRM|nr:aldolase/citrate lyase family protein [Caldinitratiruptor microaerophilus]BDG60197.1 2,4-dihydroxyhept-2-ene-1,7-dioic acid aldolase [Caldinitratiruptor microaerophilus]